MLEGNTKLQDHHDKALAAERLARLICTDLVRRPYEELHEGIREALGHVGRFCRADRCYVFLLRDDGNLMDNTHEWCAPEVAPQIHNLQDLPVAAVPWWMDHLRREDPIIVPDVSHLPPEAATERTALEAQGIESVVALPLLASGALLGFIGLDWVRSGAALTFDWQAGLLSLVSEAVANAIHRGRVEGQLREARLLSEALNRVNTALRSTLDLDEMMAAAIPECSRALQADEVAVILRQGEGWVISHATEGIAEVVGRPFSDGRFPLRCRVLEEQKPILVEDIADAHPHQDCWIHRAGFRSCLGVPLVVHGEVRGVLSFNYRRPTTFTSAQHDFAVHLSSSVSLAMESARLYQSELEHRRFLQSVTDSIPVPMAVVDGESLRLKWINSTGLGLLEESRRRLATPGAALSDLLPEEAPALTQVVRLVSATGTPHQEEEALSLGFSREETYWWMTAVPSESSAGRRDVLIVAREITEQVRARQQVEELATSLEHERDVLQAIMENTDTYLAYLNCRFELVRVNANFADGVGIAAEDLVGQCFFDMLPDLEVRHVFEWGRDNGLPVRFHERGFAFPQSRRLGPGYWDWSLLPVRNSSGEVQGLVLCLVDVTPFVLTRSRIEELVAEAQQRAAEVDEERARLKAVIDGAPEAIVVCDREGRVQMANAAAERLCAHVLVGSQSQQGDESPLVCDRDLRPCPVEELPLLRSARHGEICRAHEFVLLWEDGRRRDLRASTAPILDREGYITGAVGVYQDITDAKAAERERAHLEEMKSEFLASVSHELRTPLASIKGYTELLLDGGAGTLSPLQREFMGTVFESGERLEWLIDDLLDVSRLEVNRFGMELARVRPEELLRTTVTHIRPLAEELLVELVLEVDPVLPEVRGDPRRLEQVLSNLLSNAVKFTPPGGKITVSARETNGDTLEIAVSDTGMGIPPDDLPHLFQRFFRAHNVADSGAGGTGLGLYISKAIVDMHGGTIEARSELHQGSTFTVRLPTISPRVETP